MKRADEKFNHFNDLIDEAAISNPGFLGKESWMNTEEDKQAVTYYWSSLEMLKKFSRHPDHQKAKQLYNKWYSGYEVLISEVLELKSDGGL
jgi:heme-degrading monooxygenase HmoA